MNEKEKFMQYFRGIQVRFSRLYTRFLSQVHLTLPQYALLNILYTSGTIPMTEASSKLHTSTPAVTYLVDRLEKKQFIKRLAHEKDRRVTLLEIQPKGSKVVQKAQKMVLSFLMGTLDEFKAGEREIIGRFYGRLVGAMDDVLAKPKVGAQ